MIHAAITIASVYAAALVLYSLYLAYCTLRAMRDTGRLDRMPRFVRAHCWLILATALGLDIIFNFTVGTLVFLELPTCMRPTFTQRCKKWMHRTDGGWRTRLAKWVCDSWLNPAEPGHC